MDGHPLTDYRTIVNLIASTKTKAGLIVKVRLDKNTYERGIKVSAAELKSLNIHPVWSKYSNALLCVVCISV